MRDRRSDDGFEAWYAEAWPRVVRAVTAFGADPADAADVAAEAFARALVRWDGPDRPHDPTGWAVVVALNLARRRGRREQDRRQRLDALGPPSWAELDAVDLDLWRAVAALPPREREAVALRYAADLTEPAVADAMGITPGAVAATLHRARVKLAAALGEAHRG